MKCSKENARIAERIIDFQKFVGKKDDPNYEQVRGHIPKKLARQFKQYCLDEEIDYSEGLERILASFLVDGARQKQ